MDLPHLIYQDKAIPPLKDLLPLYGESGWTSYVYDPEGLLIAFSRSQAIYAAWDQDVLVGVLRAVGDGVSIMLIQDLIVLQAYRNNGVASELLRRFLQDYREVKKIELNVDSHSEYLTFYENRGFRPFAEKALSALIYDPK